MGISWDNDQISSLTSWIEKEVPLTGTLKIVSAIVPRSTFAMHVEQEAKEFTVYLSIDTPSDEASLMIFMGYIVTLAYDNVNWTEVPSKQNLLDSHKQVCQAMKVFNNDFAQSLENHHPILDKWHDAQLDDSTTLETDEDELVDWMGDSLFSSTKKNYGSN